VFCCVAAIALRRSSDVLWVCAEEFGGRWVGGQVGRAGRPEGDGSEDASAIEAERVADLREQCPDDTLGTAESGHAEAAHPH